MHRPALNIPERHASRRDHVRGEALRHALDALTTGVPVMTTRGTAGECRMAIDSVTSVSLDTPLVIVCVGEDSAGAAVVAANGVFAVNLLATRDEAISRRSHLDCRVVAIHRAGDQILLVGEVLELGWDGDLPPLALQRERRRAATGEPLYPAVADRRGPGMAPYLTSAEAAISEIRAGRMVVVWDGENRQNEGDLTLAGEHVTPDAINFMAKEGRGLISVALSRERCDRLALGSMSALNESPFGTDFTVTVEAREGVTTGISAADRARTIRVACDPRSQRGDLVRPGHVFPLRARPGGVLERPGHSEAAVDLARLAGLEPAGVVCQVMNDDGTMARLPDLVDFCARHRLKMVSVAALVAHRLHSGIERELAPAA
jgi:3,4-dihydroxy-2-butanone 4-phosphate synthase